MTFSFPPNRSTLSLWDIACRLTGQNATDEKPTNETRDKLAELAEAVYGNNLWVRFHPDAGFDFVRGFMPAARHARIETDWRKLDHVTVDREDWARYEEKLETTAAVTPADIEQAGSTLAQPEAAHVSKMVELINNSNELIDWDYWAGKMPRWTAYQAVRLMAALDPVKHPDLSFKRNETAGAAKEHATRLETLAASHGMTEASALDWLRWADRFNEPVHEGCRRTVALATKQAHTLKPVQEEANLWARRQPARLYGDGFSEEMQKQTTLTRYLQFDTWTPEAAAMLVCGLQAPIIDGQLRTEIPEKGAMGLDSCFIMGSHDPFHEAKRVLGIWRSQVNPPARVRPLDFVRWCQARGFDTSWLLSVEEDALRREREYMKAALGSGVVVIPSAHLISIEMLAHHLAFSLVPIPDDERLTTLKKEVPAGQGVSHIEQLTNDDRRLVHSICGKSLAGCSRAEFEAYRQKFDAAENRPEWSLVGEFRESDEMTRAQARWCGVSVAHKQQIVEWLREGGLSLVTADGIATTDTERGLVRREDVKRYLESYKLPWRDVHSEDPDAFPQGARARIVGVTQGAVTPVPIVATLFIDPVRKHVLVGEIAEMTARAVHPKGSIEWAAALDYHRKELDSAIRRGEIRGFEPSTMRPLTGQLTSLPLKGAPLANAWVSVEDVQKFASGIGVKVTFDFSEVKYEFVPETRAVIAGESQWSETVLEALCLGVPPTQYHDDCAPEAERVPIRQAILSACKSGKLDAHETGAGNAVYGGKWSIERVSAVRWAITNHFDRFPEWLARSCHAEIWKRQDEERRTAGRYTLQEAADVLERHTGTTAKDWLVKLEQAVPNDHLPVYRPGEQARYRPKIVRPFYEETYWDDLNAWLKTHEPRVKFQFAEPSTPTPTNIAPGTTVEVTPCPKKFTLYWFNCRIDEAPSFAEQAIAVLQRMKDKKSTVLHETTTPASAAGALVNEWLVNRDLPCYMRGRLIDDFAALTIGLEGDLSKTMDILESDIHLRRDDVIRLLEQEGMAVPAFLNCESPPEGPANHPVDVGQPGSGTDAPVAGDVTATQAPGNATIRHSTKLRRNILDKAVDEAIAKAGSDRTPDVFVALRDLALDGHAPFTGQIEGDALCYTNDNNEPAKLTKGALDAKLRRRRQRC